MGAIRIRAPSLLDNFVVLVNGVDVFQRVLHSCTATFLYADTQALLGPVFHQPADLGSRGFRQ